MKKDLRSLRATARYWEVARGGDFRGGSIAAREALANLKAAAPAVRRIELHLVTAFCAMRQGHHADALEALSTAAGLVDSNPVAQWMAARVATWRAELAYFQGRYTDANEMIDALLPRLERSDDRSYLAFALRVRIAILLARTDYDGAAALADRAILAAESSGDDYVTVQVLNVLGAVHFDRATSKLDAPHARAHLSSLDRSDALPLEADAREALQMFQRARTVAERAGYTFAAWYVAGNIERLEILLGHADRVIGPIRRRLRVLQQHGATYDEIVARSNLAWGLRMLARHREALHELDVALRLARQTGTANVLLEFLEYDRSIVLDALGDEAGARASYRRYLSLVGASASGVSAQANNGSSTNRRALEPYFLKRADRYVHEHVDEPFTVAELARHCGVSWRTLEKAFSTFRGLAPVAHVRNLRLDRAHRALAESDASVGDIAVRHGFRSPTTFALEYRRRFGVSPRAARRALRTKPRAFA